MRDERSRNGTFVNGLRIKPGTPNALRDGDNLRVVDTTMTVADADIHPSQSQPVYYPPPPPTMPPETAVPGRRARCQTARSSGCWPAAAWCSPGLLACVVLGFAVVIIMRTGLGHRVVPTVVPRPYGSGTSFAVIAQTVRGFSGL